MKTIYLECNMGAAGDMLMASLLELHGSADDFLRKLNRVGIPGVIVTAKTTKKCGIIGTHIKVEINGRVEHSEDHHYSYHGEDIHYHTHEDEHSHNSYHDMEHLIGNLQVSDTVKKNVLEIYKSIAEAESQVHGVPVTKIHFHEVGEMDAVADIVGVCMLIEELEPDLILASPINVGSGQVHCAHGILPVPAPATAHLLKGIPSYGGEIKGELCTPTGAAILKYFVSKFGNMPTMQISQIGYGMGSKDFEAANCVRALLGETAENKSVVVELNCNLDDMTPEAIGFAQEQLFESGALDVYTIAIGMKKSRPGVLLCCMCRPEEREQMVRLLFKHTTTIGIREYLCNRYVLEHSIKDRETKYGKVNVKQASGWGVSREKVEYEDLANIARQTGQSILDISKKL